MNTKDLTLENVKLKCLIYGKAGTGKTTFAGTFPKPFFFDFDKGMLSLRGKDIEYETFESYASFLSKWNEKLKDETETLVIDSITTLEEYCQKYVIALNKKNEMTLQLWGILIDHLQSLFLSVAAVKKHVVVTAHEQTIQDGVTGEVMILPLISGKQLPGQMGLFFDEVYRSQVMKDKEGKPQYQILTRADVKYTAKSRLGILETVEVPTFQNIMNKIKGGERK